MKKEQVKKFIKVSLAGLFIGFFIGFIYEFLNITAFDFTNFKELFPYLILLVTLADIIILMIFNNLKSKIAKDNYSDDENSQFAKYEKTLLITQSLSTMLIMTNFLFLSGLASSFMFILIVPFSINAALGGYLEVSHINLLKEVQPSKNADPTEFDYNDKAIETLDEGELHTLGKVALKTINKMIIVYVAFMLLGVFTAQNTMFFICVWGIYIAQSSLMVYYSLKLGDFKA